MLSLQVMWLLDNFTHQNGATMFWPGSHSWLKQPEYDFSTPEDAQLLLAPAGSVLIAHGAWWLPGVGGSRRPGGETRVRSGVRADER